MAKPRSSIVDESVTPWYHCISRCVRREPLCGGTFAYRKQWIEDRLKELAEIFSIECAGFAVMDNHLHLLLRLDSRQAERWTDEEVARRWLQLFPFRDVAGKSIPVTKARIRQYVDEPHWVDKTRKRLATLSWFMKCLKEPIARRANREDEVTGAFWEGRFKSIAVLDDTSLLSTAAYIDLNPLAAGTRRPRKNRRTPSLRAAVEIVASSSGSDHTLHEDLSVLTQEIQAAGGRTVVVASGRQAGGRSRASRLDGRLHALFLSERGRCNQPDDTRRQGDPRRARCADLREACRGPKNGGKCD